MKKKIVISVLVIMALLACSCGKKTGANSKTDDIKEETSTDADNSGDTDATSDSGSISDAGTDTTPDAGAAVLSADDCRDAYIAFINDEASVYFDKDFIHKDVKWLYATVSAVSAEYESCTFSELLDTYIKALGSEYDGCDIRIENIAYSIIDCGNDGIPELAVLLHDLYIGETMYFDDFFVIKMMPDGKLQMCFFDESSYRSINYLNQNGMYFYSMAFGMSDFNSYEYIDENGDLQFDYAVDTYYDAYGFGFGDSEELSLLASDLGIEDMAYESYALDRFEEDVTYEERNAAKYWTYYENESSLYGNTPVQDEAILQDDSPYRQFWNETGMNVYSYAEIEQKIAEKEQSLGITKDIFEAPEIQWIDLDSNQLDKVYPQGSAAPSSSSSNAAQLQNTAVELVIDNPSWDYYNAEGLEAHSLTIKLDKVFEEQNDIIDEYEWFQSLGIEPFDRRSFADSNYKYELRTTDNFDPYLLDVYDAVTGDLKVTLNMCRFYYPEEYAQADLYFVGEYIRWAQSSYYGDVIYVCTSHGTYASSASANAFITAIQLNDTFDDYKVLWKSKPLRANAQNFVTYGDFIICGYGFTAEPDYIYILDKFTGAELANYPVKTGPDYFYVDGNKLYVRTYDMNYEYEIKEQ